MTVRPNGREIFYGAVYVLFQYSLLPPLLFSLNRSLPRALTEGQLNFLFFALNCLASLLIFRRFLKESAVPFRAHLRRCLQIVLVGFLLGTLSQVLSAGLAELLVPGFLNRNDQALEAMAGSEFLLTALGTVLLVPPAEECIYRGLIFAGFYPRSPLAAYLVSAGIFSAIHILGYLGIYTGAELAAAFLQYLLPGLILAWSLRRSDSIYVPMLIHALINLKGTLLFSVR